MFCKVFLTLMRQIGLMPLIFKKETNWNNAKTRFSAFTKRSD